MANLTVETQAGLLHKILLAAPNDGFVAVGGNTLYLDNVGAIPLTEDEQAVVRMILLGSDA